MVDMAPGLPQPHLGFISTPATVPSLLCTIGRPSEGLLMHLSDTNTSQQVKHYKKYTMNSPTVHVAYPYPLLPTSCERRASSVAHMHACR